MEALKSEPRWQVDEVRDRTGFSRLESAWNALVQSTDNQIFYRHEFFRIVLDNFVPEGRLRVLVARDESGRMVAALPLVEERALVYGVPVTQLISASNPHSCRFDLIARDGPRAAQVFFSHLAADKNWDLIRLADVPEEGKGWHFYKSAHVARFPVGIRPSLESPFIPLPETLQNFQKKLDSKFKANLRRRARKLAEKGAVSFQKISGGMDLEHRLEEGFALERSGWKGERGTAIAQSKQTRGFYGELARTAAYRGWLSLFFMRVDQKPAAFHYALTYNKRYFLLKPAYDESLKECSPGQLLMEEVIKDCFDHQLVEFDFLGPKMVWKQDWTDQVRKHSWLFVFRDSTFGRALCNAKCRWAPTVKEIVVKWTRT